MVVESTTLSPVWFEFLPKLLGRIAACCPKPTDRTSFHAVCRSWHSAACHNYPRMPLLQWVVLRDGSFLTLSDDGRDLPQGTVRYSEFVHPTHGLCSLTLPDPENTACVGSMGGWLAHCHHDRWSSRADDYSFVLHNPFSDTTVLLPDVDGVGSIALPGVFDALKVLMHSTAKDIVASCPTIKVILNVTFLGGKLYGITKVEDLFSFDLALLQDEKMPTVTDCKQVIRQPLDKQCYDYVPWSDVDDEEDQENNDDDGDDELASISGEKYGSSEDEYEEEKELE
uniref:KIB1-4 beta-propeller domain-containing protein n=1 Tax=Setaria italica TaxID=4555 RepID=K4A2P9_SETIT